MMESKMKPICFIPARGGSKGVKCKNIKKLDGMEEYSSDVVPNIPINELKNIFKNLI